MFYQPRAKLEMWAGIECTINRVGQDYFDQLQASGHYRRVGDLHLFAELGIRALRYPILWERWQSAIDRSVNWSWCDERLSELRRLDVRPIVGLVHHGSGPRYTSVLDDSFAEGLAAYAHAVARRYPWVDAYTPVNEPLTTARFSALYGHWFPHARDSLAFCRALLNQCRAVVLAMRTVREVNSSAQLIQTDDLGKTTSTPELRIQADFENERRWITWDLLCGQVNRQHPMWSFFTWCGVHDCELAWFTDNPCPPDVIGVNYYVTGERFLDTGLERYPRCTHGGNHETSYADVEAVRALKAGIEGVGPLLMEAWQRYGKPLAVTEAHLGCTREEQMRWLSEIWRDASFARARGADVRAVTAWALLGAFDWDTLLTRVSGRYESGVFDVRSVAPRPTALAGLVCDFAEGRAPDHPVLDSPGWWRRDDRLLYPAATCASTPSQASASIVNPNRRMAIRPLLITGGGGTLATAFDQMCENRGLARRQLTRAELDITDAASIRRVLTEVQPWAVINAAGNVHVDVAEADGEQCYRDNRLGPKTLADACAESRIALATFSTDLVFDGGLRRPYTEEDATAPLSVFGAQKAAAELEVLGATPRALVIRTSALFGPDESRSFVANALAKIARGHRAYAAGDSTVSPTYLPDLVNACLDLLIDGESGIWHLSNTEPVTWADFARRAAWSTGLDGGKVVECKLADFGYAAPRPLYSALNSERAAFLLPTLEDAIRRFTRERSAICC